MLKFKREKTEQQLSFFYPDNEVIIMTLVFFFITHFNFVTVFTISSLTYTLESNSTILTQLHSTLLVRHPFFFTSTGFCDPLAQVHLHHVQHLHSLTTACSCTWKTNHLQKHLHLVTSTGTCTCTCPPTCTCTPELAHSLEDSPLAQRPRTHHRQYLSPQGKPLRPEVGFL